VKRSKEKLAADPSGTGIASESDASLFADVAGGDLGALGVLFDRHHESVRQFLLRAARSTGDVDDLVQETFLTAARAAGSYDGRDNARPFLIGVSAQLLRRGRRGAGRYRALLERIGLAPSPPPPTPEESSLVAERSSGLHAAIARLSEDRRIALVMVEWSGMTAPEVAKSLGIPVGTVWRRLHEARTELRRTLERSST